MRDNSDDTVLTDNRLHAAPRHTSSPLHQCSGLFPQGVDAREESCASRCLEHWPGRLCLLLLPLSCWHTSAGSVALACQGACTPLSRFARRISSVHLSSSVKQ
eukprot:scaffold160768_cov36-Tisochrysis_lutea.AAC.2